METGITFDMQDYFANQTELLELISGKYVRKGSGELFEANLKHLFPGNEEQAKLINPGSYIAGIVFEWISGYIGQPKEKQNINYIDLIEGLLTTGYFRFYQNIDTGKLETVKADKYFYDKNLQKEYFVNIYEVKEDFYRKKYYLLIETYQKGIFERKLFLLNNIGSLSYGEQVSFDELEFLAGKPEMLKIENLDRLVIERQVERPLLEKIKTIIFSIEKKLAEIDKNFLDYTEQFKIFRNVVIPDNCYKTLSNGIKVIDFDKLGKILVVDEINGTGGGLEIVRNTNNLLVQSIEYLDDQIRSISAITSIPLFAFGIKLEGGNESGTSKIKSAGLFYKKIEKYREIIINLFLEFWENFKIPDSEQILEFGEILTSDITEIVEIQKTMLDSGIQSKKRAIMKINSTDEIEAEEILREIEEEKQRENLNNNQEKGEKLEI
ncbi:hypothetical protein BKN14_00385 [Candidatus Gracilibacteria bacterium HOT-871]|nr:hypothetical protein BKN14_00385 [Candidatus Gracilibacteria bacterium HOT-871]